MSAVGDDSTGSKVDLLLLHPQRFSTLIDFDIFRLFTPNVDVVEINIQLFMQFCSR